MFHSGSYAFRQNYQILSTSPVWFIKIAVGQAKQKKLMLHRAIIVNIIQPTCRKMAGQAITIIIMHVNFQICLFSSWRIVINR